MSETYIETEPTPPNLSNSGQPEPVLYHYTNFFGLAGIATSKSMWCSQIHYLNDTSELIHGLKLLKRVCSEYSCDFDFLSNVAERVMAYKGVSVYVCSFTEEEDLLSQWRGYSGNAGVSIGFSFEKLKAKAMQNGFIVSKCIYEDAEKILVTQKFVQQQIDASKTDSEPEKAADRIIAKFLSIAARFKQKSFAEEKEWRLISPPIPSNHNQVRVRATPSGLLPYFEFDLKTREQPLVNNLQPWRTNEDICLLSAMIGPNKEQTLQMSAVGILFDSNDTFVKSVSRSAIPFKMM